MIISLTLLFVVALATLSTRGELTQIKAGAVLIHHEAHNLRDKVRIQSWRAAPGSHAASTMPSRRRTRSRLGPAATGLVVRALSSKELASIEPVPGMISLSVCARTTGAASEAW